MIEHARRVTGVSEVAAVAGGFHLGEVSKQTTLTIAYLKDLQVKRVIPSHCTFDPSLALFHKEFGSSDLLTGGCLVF
jgi:7,8-dihydropterin-6-yl-methyl-4-(beta-D-ribofuranosyl)aminobenzene 5'-phosphate synthase